MKRISIFFSIFFSLIYFSSIYPWGEKGHALIAKESFKALHYEMIDFIHYADIVISKSSDPDKRRPYTPGEAPKHFIDIDFYNEFIEARMITDIDSLKKVYGDSIVVEMGILPWATLQTYYKLVESFKLQNPDSIIYYAADLSHYVADGFQPMHATINYDGQLSNQKGIHSRYETIMFNKHLSEIQRVISPRYAKRIENIQSFIFDYIYASSFYSSLVFEADSIAKNISQKQQVRVKTKNSFSIFATLLFSELKKGAYPLTNFFLPIKSTLFYLIEITSNSEKLENQIIYDDKYYELLWFRTKDMTISRAEKAAEAIASLYYTAWIEAGKPKIPKFNEPNYYSNDNNISH